MGLSRFPLTVVSFNFWFSCTKLMCVGSHHGKKMPQDQFCHCLIKTKKNAGCNLHSKIKTIIYIMWTNFFITQCFVLKDHLPTSHKNSHVTRKVVKYFRYLFPSIPTEIRIWLVSTFMVKTEKRQSSQYSVFMPSVQLYLEQVWCSNLILLASTTQKTSSDEIYLISELIRTLSRNRNFTQPGF